MLLSYFATLPIAMQHNWQHLLLPLRVTIWASARAYFVKQKPSPNQKDMLHYKLIFFQMVFFLRDATSTTILQHFYNKSQVVSCYWFKFETNSKITFLSQQ